MSPVSGTVLTGMYRSRLCMMEEIWTSCSYVRKKKHGQYPCKFQDLISLLDGHLFRVVTTIHTYVSTSLPLLSAYL